MNQVYFGSAGFQSNCLYAEAFTFTGAVTGSATSFSTVTALVYGVEVGDVIVIANSSNSDVLVLGSRAVSTKGSLTFNVYTISGTTADVTFQAMLFRPENPLT